MGTFVTEDTERITALRTELAKQALQEYLQKVESLGFSREEAARIILELEEE